MGSCPFCSEWLPDDQATYCPHCGRPLGAPAAPPLPQDQKTSGKAIASLIFGIPFFLIFTAIVAVVLGHLAKRDIRRSGGRLTGNGLATGGLVLGYTGVAFVGLLILLSIAIPNLLHSRMLANEASAVGTLRTLSMVANQYSATYNNGFPPSLAALGASAGGGNNSTCDYANLIDSTLAAGRKSGYVFTYAGKDPVPTAGHGCANPGFQSYGIQADPITRGESGQHSFFVDPSGVIRRNAAQPATASDPPIAY